MGYADPFRGSVTCATLAESTDQLAANSYASWTWELLSVENIAVHGATITHTD